MPYSSRNLQLLLSGAVLFALLPLTASACPPGQYELLAPIGTLTGCVTIATYLKGILETIIGIAGVLAVIMIVICGIQMMASGSAAGKSAAKECITNAIFGVLLAIGSWLLLNTINPLLLKNTQSLVDPVAVVVVPPAGPLIAPMPTNPGWYFRYRDTNGSVNNSPRYESSGVCLTKQQVEIGNGSVIQNGPNGTPGCFEVRAVPQPAGEAATRNTICGNDSCVGSSNSNVYINNTACVGSQTNGCTNVNGYNVATINDLKGFATACACKITITGGTEGGHSSHGPNIPVFDISKTAFIEKYVKDNSTVKKNPSFSDRASGVYFYKWLYAGYWWTDETGGSKTPHWHVCKVGTPSPTANTAGLFQKACNQI